MAAFEAVDPITLDPIPDDKTAVICCKCGNAMTFESFVDLMLNTKKCPFCRKCWLKSSHIVNAKPK